MTFQSSCRSRSGFSWDRRVRPGRTRRRGRPARPGRCRPVAGLVAPADFLGRPGEMRTCHVPTGALLSPACPSRASRSTQRLSTGGSSDRQAGRRAARAATTQNPKCFSLRSLRLCVSRLAVASCRCCPLRTPHSAFRTRKCCSPRPLRSPRRNTPPPHLFWRYFGQGESAMNVSVMEDSLPIGGKKRVKSAGKPTKSVKVRAQTVKKRS